MCNYSFGAEKKNPNSAQENHLTDQSSEGTTDTRVFHLPIVTKVSWMLLRSTPSMIFKRTEINTT